MLNKKYIIIYPPVIDWNWMKQRPQGLMSALAKLGNKVYYCQNLEKRVGVQPIEIENNLYLCYDPDLIDVSPDIVWLGNPGIQKEWVGKYKEKFLVYDCVDDFYKFWGHDEDELTDKADIIVTTSKILYDRKREKKEKVYLVPNGVDSSFFKTERKDIVLDDIDIYNSSIVKIGYIGALANWIDYDLLFKLANFFGKFLFFLIGVEFHPIPIEIKNKKISNVIWLGLKSHDILKYYIDKMDICLVPFKKNEITEATDPVKIYEYLARGKAVVSTKLKTIEENFNGLVYLSDDFSEFVENINLALTEIDCQEKIEKRISFAKKNTWDKRAEEVMNILKRVI